MKTRVKIVTILSVMACLLLAVAPALADAPATLTGQVSDANEIVTDDGTTYTIASTEKGDELAEMVGEVVTVTGTLAEAEGEKVITVINFSVVEK
jgi:hypothetical protein